MEKNIDEIFLLLEHRLDWILKELEGLEKLLIELFHANNANVESSSIEIRAERLRTLLSDLNDAACDWAQIETKLRESIISQLKSTSQQPGACPPSPIGEMERLLSLYTHFKRLQNRTQYLLFNVDLSVSIPTHNRLYINFLMSDPHEVVFSNHSLPKVTIQKKRTLLRIVEVRKSVLNENKNKNKERRILLY